MPREFTSQAHQSPGGEVTVVTTIITKRPQRRRETNSTLIQTRVNTFPADTAQERLGRRMHYLKAAEVVGKVVGGSMLITIGILGALAALIGIVDAPSALTIPQNIPLPVAIDLLGAAGSARIGWGFLRRGYISGDELPIVQQQLEAVQQLNPAQNTRP